MKTAYFGAYLTAALLSVGLVSKDASAGPSPTRLWSTISTGCTISPASVSIAQWSSSSSRVSFSGNNTGTITLSCPIRSFLTADTAVTNPDRFTFVFYDPDGTTDNCSVSMALVTQNTSATDGGHLVTQYDGTTDTSLAGSPFRNAEGATFSETFDFDNNFYYVQVDLVRTVTTCNPIFVGMTLGTGF